MLKPMLKTGYTNHVDADIRPDGQYGYVIVNKVVPNASGKQSRDVHIFEVFIPTLVITRKVKSYVEGIDMPGPAGYCTVKYLPDNTLWVNLAIARQDNANEIVWHTEIVAL